MSGLRRAISPRTAVSTISRMMSLSRSVRRRAAWRLSQVGVGYPMCRLAVAGGSARVLDREVPSAGRRTRLYELLRQRQHLVLLPAGAQTLEPGRLRSN